MHPRALVPLLALVLGDSFAAAPTSAPTGVVDLRAFDGRASTLLRRIEEAGLRVYLLVDVADLKVPKLEAGMVAKAAVERLAKESGLVLDWIDGQPLLWRRDDRLTSDIPSTWEMGWTADRGLLAEVLARWDRVEPLRPEDRALSRHLCAEAVLRFGRAAGVALLDRKKTEQIVRYALTSPDWLLRRQAVLAAADLGLADAQAVVRKATADEHPQVRTAAAVAAGRLSCEPGYEILRPLRDHLDTSMRQAAAVGWGERCSSRNGGPGCGVTPLTDLLGDTDPYVRVYAAWSLGEVGTDPAVQALGRAAASEDSRLRRAAAAALGRCRGQGAVQGLIALLPDVEETVKPGAAAAISLGWQGGPEAVKALVAALDADSPRLEVIYGLGLAGGDDARRVLEPLLKHESEAVRRAAAWALGRREPVSAEPFDIAAGTKVASVPDRPRVFLRRDDWDGPTLARMRANFRRPDYQDPVRKDKLPNTRIGQAVLWMVSGDELAGRETALWAGETVSGGYNRTTGSTPSYAGISLQRNAALYDWTHEHGDVPPVVRRLMMHHLEENGDYFLNAFLKPRRETVFYSRRWGALSGTGVAGAALFGDSPRGREQLAWVVDQLTSDTGLATVRQAQDGASAGSSYGLHHLMTDCANVVAAVRSATDFDLGRFTQERRGDWLQKQMYFQMWMTYPDGRFVKDGDQWGGRDTDQYRMQIDVITGMYQNGFGRTWADQMHERWPKYFPSDYHTEFVWQFFVFNDPEVKPRPLSEMPRTAVFSPDLDGYVFWRSSWEKDATIVLFHCGDSVDMHGAHDQGKFILFKHRALAAKNGSYTSYGSAQHSYYRSPWSGNCVVFDDGKNNGRQPSYTAQGGNVNSFAEFLAGRKWPPVGKLVLTEANERFARAVGNLDGATPDKGTNSKWTRELVFLGYRYLLVLDRVKCAPGVTARWVLNFEKEPELDGGSVRLDHPPGRLFVQTLLPEAPKVLKVGGPTATPEMKAGNDWRIEVTGPAPAAAEQVFLAVLYATDGNTESAPKATLTRDGATMTVRVGDLTHTFEAPKQPQVAGNVVCDAKRRRRGIPTEMADR